MNSLWPSDAFWHCRSQSPWHQVTVWYLVAPSHHLMRCWLTINKIIKKTSPALPMIMLIPSIIKMYFKTLVSYLHSLWHYTNLVKLNINLVLKIKMTVTSLRLLMKNINAFSVMNAIILSLFALKMFVKISFIKWELGVCEMGNMWGTWSFCSIWYWASNAELWYFLWC